MSRMERFEDLECWQAARACRRDVYRLSRLPDFSRNHALVTQIRRAAISIGLNVAEGFERGGNREFIQFLSQAKGSAGETKEQLYVALDEAYITQEQFDQAYALGETASRLIGGFMSYLRKTAITGYKFDKAVAPPNPKPKTQNPKP
ncbi:MAG: four helix bundle protein [Opitutaceae bacterium]